MVFVITDEWLGLSVSVMYDSGVVTFTGHPFLLRPEIEYEVMATYGVVNFLN